MLFRNAGTVGVPKGNLTGNHSGAEKLHGGLAHADHQSQKVLLHLLHQGHLH